MQHRVYTACKMCSNAAMDDSVSAVRVLRSALGETLQEFAGRLGLSISAITNYEAGRAPTGKALVALAHAAREAGRHDLSHDFMYALANELGLSKLKLGLFSYPPASTNPAGYMLVTFEGRNAKEYSQAFFETFGRYLYGSPDEQQRAGKLLDDFNNAAFREWRLK